MMSVASPIKTKMYIVITLGCLSLLSCWWTRANTIPEVESWQDLTVLWSKLKERFSWVTQEVRSLVDGTTTPLQSFYWAGKSSSTTGQSNVVVPMMFGQDFFGDIGNDPYTSYINRLASYWVLSHSQKFYPQNYLRVADLQVLLSKLSVKALGKPYIAPEYVWSLPADGIATKWILQQSLMTLGLDGRVQIEWNLYDKLIRSESAYYLVRAFDLPVVSFHESARQPSFVQDSFTDIWGHPFWSAINTLANLGIVNTQTTKFYPDNYLRHYDFVLLFVNSLVASQDQSVPNISASFADVQADASYLPQLAYAVNRGLIDYIVVSKRGQLYFEPDSFMTKYEVYKIVNKVTNTQLIYNEQQASQEKMTRGELAQLLVQTFQLTPNISPELDEEELSLITKLKTLLALL